MKDWGDCGQADGQRSGVVEAALVGALSAFSMLAMVASTAAALLSWIESS